MAQAPNHVPDCYSVNPPIDKPRPKSRSVDPDEHHNDPSFGNTDPPRSTYIPPRARKQSDRRPEGAAPINYTGPKVDPPNYDATVDTFCGEPTSTEQEFARRIEEYQRDHNRGHGGIVRTPKR
jgi:hypothetical protein